MKDFTPYNESLELKELGFDKPCFALYSIIEHDDIEIGDFYFGPSYATNATEGVSILAPTFSQAFRFFRDNFNLEPQVKSWKEKGGIVWHYSIQKIGEPSIFRSSDCAVDSHDEAQLICLQKLIQIVKTK